MSTQSHIRYQIDDLLLDTRLGTLSRNEEEIALPQLSYRLLCVLVESAPAIISQDELMNQVWGSQVVSDETLKQRIKLLRQALNDTPQSPKYIESVRGRGYRCVARIKKQVIRPQITSDSINLRLNDSLPVTYIQASREYWRLAGLFLLIAALVISSSFALSRLWNNNQSKVPATVSKPSEDKAKAAYEKGRTFYLRYQPMDNTMAIRSFEKATELDPNFALAFAGLANAYSQGVFQFNGEEGWRKSALDAAFEAVMLDDSLAQSYKALGNAHYVNGHISQSLSANLKAVELDKDFVEAQASLGYIYSQRGELKNALQRHLKVLDLDKDYQVNWFHLALTLQRLSENYLAQNWYRHLLAEQPNYHLATFHYSHLLQQMNKQSEALALLQQAESRSPDNQNVLRGLIDYYLLDNSPKQAAPWFHKLALLSGSHDRQYAKLLSLLTEQPIDNKQLNLWYQEHAAEYDERAFHCVQLAMAAAMLKQNDAALRHLTEAVELGWLDSHYLKELPFFSHLQQQPKFALVLQFIERKKQTQKKLSAHLKAPKQLPD